MRRILVIFMLFVMLVSPISAATITSFLEVVLAEDGILIDGKKSVTVQLLSPKNEIRWQETHTAQFFKGRTSFEIGHLNEIKTHWFYDEGVQLILTIGTEKIALPMKSIPFSLFSHAADIVNAIHMEGVFHTNLIAERIGINIKNPTPSVRLEVGGAMRVGDHPSIDELGTIRWRNNRLEGRHNDVWKYLDVSPADGYDSKWTNNQSNTIPAFFVKDTFVRIATKTNKATLTVGGDVFVERGVRLDGPLTAAGHLNLLNNYGVSKDAELTVRSVTLNASNYINANDGLKVSGKLIGKGHGVTHVSAPSLKINGIQNNEIADLAITHVQIAANAVGNSALNDASIKRLHLTDDFKLTNAYFKPLIVTDNEIKRESIVSSNLASNFELTIYLFKDDAVVSRNIGAQNIDYTKIKDGTLISEDYATPMVDRHGIIKDDAITSVLIKDNDILATDFQPGALSFSHLNAIIPIDKGGTNQTGFSTVGGLIVVSSNQMISAPKVVLNANGLGINNASPEFDLDILNQAGKTAVKMKSQANAASGLAIENDIGRWYLGLTSTGNFEILDQLKSRQILVMNHADGHLGIRRQPGTQKLSIQGGVLLGDTSISSPKPGTMFYSKAQNKFKLVLASGITQLEFNNEDNMTSGSFFIAGLDNHSNSSRILLGQDSRVEGESHLVSGIKNTHLSGLSNRVEMVQDSMIRGQKIHAMQLDQSYINCHLGRLNRVFNSFIQGQACHASQVYSSQLKGDYNAAEFINNSSVQGNHLTLHQLDASLINGEGHDLSFVTNGDVSGYGHQLYFANNTVVLNQRNRIRHIQNAVILGYENTIRHARDLVTYGFGHHVGFSDGATVVGRQHTVVHGQGVYMGEKHRHIGHGAPIILGQNNTAIGYHDATIDGDHIISIGTNLDSDLTIDQSISFHALGGFNVLKEGVLVARLGANAGSWSSISDQSIKTNIEGLNPNEILNKALQLDIMEWRYKGQHYVQHIGPMAQDFYKVFGLGRSNKYIQTVDMDGVILGSIKGLGNYYQTIVQDQDNYQALKVDVLNSSDKLVVNSKMMIEHLNELNESDRKLTGEYNKIHQKETLQSQEIESLTHQMGKLQQRMEGLK